MNKKLVIGSLIVLGILGSYFFPRGNTLMQRIGAVATLDGVDNPRVCIGGLCQQWVSKQIEATSTYPCKIANPFIASSTLLSFNINVSSTSVMGAQKLDISTTSSSGGYGSTTPALVYGSTIFGGLDSVVWLPNVSSSTNVNVISVNGGPGTAATSSGQTLGAIVYPGGFVSARIATGTPGTFTLAGGFNPYWKGTCTALFQGYVGR